jgi:small subunit ribosomal protein S19
MAKKEFTYRGHTLAQLQAMSIDELSAILPSPARRKIKRGFTEQEKILLHRLSKKNTVKTHCRDMIILPFMVGRIIKVVRGNSFEDVRVTAEMIGHRLGEFSLTRKRLKHGQAGIGSTKGSAGSDKK